MSKLVIVESPAKAKTISRFLGSEYEVEASFGHVRDLPERADDIPAAYKQFKWAKLGVNVDNGYEPLYIVPADKKKHVDNLKRASKGVDELLLATDEDREGESISWHVLKLLDPKSKTKVSRIVFHEITPEAIKEALRNPRPLDEDLVRAQETRRILDRLYGYTLSPLLWKKVAPKLSAGRVQSVAVRLAVIRERERMAFREAEYWDLEADLQTEKGKFKAQLARIDGDKVATGKSFDPTTGLLKDKARLLDQQAAKELVEEVKANQTVWTVKKVDAVPGQESPPQPFMTSTLQQEANRKLGFTSKRTMHLAQNLYEGIDLGGERIGLITYMRTDSLTLSERALTEAREVIKELYGSEYLPDKPVRYKTKAKNAQEAHEAIRPTDLARRPQDISKFLDRDQLALYELIWKRTIACQMKPAKVLRTSIEIESRTKGSTLLFATSGKQILFPGFLRAYVEGSDDPDSELESRETILPPLAVGQIVDLLELKSLEHHTRPPARYTEASLVKKLEEEGVGRPSTYASIISTIQDRGYIFKRSNELVPTFTALAVTQLLENHFGELVDIAFTARMETELDEIADGKRDSVGHLKDFYRGHEAKPGLEKQVETETENIPFPSLTVGDDPNTGSQVVIRVGRFGCFIQRGEGGSGNTATIPDDLAPAELTLDKAVELLERKGAGPEAVGRDPKSGQCVFFRTGRFGDYLEVAQSKEEEAAKDKPRRVTLPKGVKPADLSEEELGQLLQLPRSLGKDESGEEIIVSIGQYGAYIKCGAEARNLEDWRAAASIRREEAEALLSQPRHRRGGVSAGPQVPRTAIHEFGALEGASGPVKVLPGRFGPYVTDGKVNATIPKSIDPAEITPEQALELLVAKASSPGTKRRGRKTFAKRTTRRSA